MNFERHYVKIKRQKGQNWAPKWSKNGPKLVQLRGTKTWQLKVPKSAPGGCQEQNFEINVGGRGGGLLIE